MRAFSLLLPVLSLLSATANAITTHTHTLTLHQWPLGAPHPTILGKVSYNSATGEGGFGVAEHSGAWAESGEEEEVRVGVWNGETWLFGCVVVGVSMALWVFLGGGGRFRMKWMLMRWMAAVENVEASGECGYYG